MTKRSRASSKTLYVAHRIDRKARCGLWDCQSSPQYIKHRSRQEQAETGLTPVPLQARQVRVASFMACHFALGISIRRATGVSDKTIIEPGCGGIGGALIRFTARGSVRLRAPIAQHRLNARAVQCAVINCSPASYWYDYLSSCNNIEQHFTDRNGFAA
jgi:hypothetical protein